MMRFADLKALIEKRGVAPNLGPEGEGWNMSQQPDELATFLVDMLRLKVKSVLEIGTGSGGHSRFLAEDLGWEVTTMDIGQPGNVSEKVEYINGDSLTVDMPNKQYDLVFIDGDHSYAGVSGDYRRFKNCAKKAIAFHDVTGLTGCVDVQRFWYETAYDPNTNALKPGFYQVSHTDPQAAPGIGWIVLGDLPPYVDNPVDDDETTSDDIPF
jgi:hypothetical protein